MSRRIEALDVLRGVAILGTLGTNIWLFTDPGGPASAAAGLTGGGAVEAFLRFLSNGKFLALLTLLFGIGLELQYRSAVRRGVRWPGRYLWRAALLLAEGALHYVLIFEYDVLMGYAVTSMLVAYLIGRGDRVVRGWMWAMGALHVAAVALVTAALFGGEAVTGAPDAPGGLYSEGSYLDQVRSRLELADVYRAESVLIIPMGTVMFLLGARLLRAGALEDSARGARLRGRLMIVGLGAGAPLNLLTSLAGPGWFMVDRYLLPPLVALGLLGLVTTLVLRLRGEPGRMRRGLTAVGRTALSCYVFQNLVASVLCYGWGLGLAARLDWLRPWWVPFAWAGICAAFMASAIRWLRRHERGPLEAAWQWAYAAPWRPARRVDGGVPGDVK
ncbi:DUF418 domain-containing protein [Bailinhaonella thermotolerans]|uniref:DUF418 domain-containing protein n=1 Tax=Bailinhaonella thermotolerans TaxID=1070861 RepID=A0A3A4AAY6_9ACTN|nr:DUF418 domain-containing protein [Bailinhaonella thermotolerans]RJL22598.1 DUF418 domain-containing protein [Bailinhaonella thermotolerans]